MSIDGLFLGLGNPGPTYEHTRHNFGFMLADMLLDYCRAHGAVSTLSGGKGKYDAWKCSLPAAMAGRPAAQGDMRTWIIAKPMTFMNKSGEAAVHLLGYYKIPLSALMVAHDELDLPLGRMRIKVGGSAAGHNGIRSISELTGSVQFTRLRLGIGKPVGYDTVSYVLGRFSSDECRQLGTILEAAVSGVRLFAGSGFTPAQRFINAFTLAPG